MDSIDLISLIKCGLQIGELCESWDHTRDEYNCFLIITGVEIEKIRQIKPN